jgi:hypothetical protein
MAFTTYTTLVAAKSVAGSIKRQVNYDKIDADVVLENAQTLIYSTLRVREMRALGTLAMSVGDSTKALPSGYLDPIGALRDTKNYWYTQRSEDRLLAARMYDPNGVLQSGQPTFWSVFDELVQFDLKFAEARTLLLPYYKQPDPLSGGNPTNWLTNRYPHLLRQACTVQAHAFMKNWAGYNTELPLLAPLIEKANAEADLSYRGADLDQDLP